MRKFKLFSGMKPVLAIALAGTMFMTTGLTSLACTGVYFGSQATTDGTTIYGRSEDLEEDHDKVWEVWKAEDHKDGDMYEDNYGFSCPYPAHTLSFTACRDTTDMGETDPNAIAYGEVGINEKGVSISATVSTRCNDKIKKVDPLVDTGLCEISIATMVLQEATTAKNGVEILGAIVDKHGAGECNILTIGDANETWFMEIVSGHQWIARRLPANKVTVFANMMSMDQVDTKSSDVLCSANLIKTAKDANAYYTENKNDVNSIHISKSYSEGYSASNTYRAWDGMNFLNPVLAAKSDPTPVADFAEFAPNANETDRAGNAALNAKGPFTFLYDADRKVSLKDAMKILSLRGAGTQYEAEEVANRAIGWHTQMECHFMQTKENMPAELATVQWLGMGCGEFTVYVPSYAAILKDTADFYKYDKNEFSYNSMYWVYEEINKICNEYRTKTASVVSTYFDGIQDRIIAEQADVEKKALELSKAGKSEELAKYATESNAKMGAEALEEGQYVLYALKEYVANGTKGEFKLDGKKTATKVATPSLVLKSAKKSIKATWTATKNADKYEIKISRNKNMKNAKTMTAKVNSKTIKSLKKNTKYYVKVRTCKKDYQGKNVWSRWSKVVSVKTK